MWLIHNVKANHTLQVIHLFMRSVNVVNLRKYIKINKKHLTIGRKNETSL